MVCGEVVDMLGDNIAGFDPLELVCAYKAVIYDGGDSAPLSLKRVCVVRDSAHVGGSRGVAEARSVVAGDVSFSWGHCSNW